MAEKERGYSEVVPEVEIRALIEAGHQQVLIRWHRRDRIKGHLGSLKNIGLPTVELLDGSFDDKIRQLYGGGDFIIDPRSVTDSTQKLLERPYMIHIPGEPLNVRQQAAGVAALSGDPTAMPTAYPHLPRLPNGGGWPAWGQPIDDRLQQFDPQQFMSQRPDEIAMYFNGLLVKQTEETKSEMQKLRDETAKQLELARERAEAAEKRLAEERGAAAVKALEQKIDLLSRTPTPKPTFDVAAIAAVVTALSPIATAFIAANNGRAEANLRLQQENTKAQFDGLRELVKVQVERAGGSDKVFDMLTKVVPLVVPLGKVWLEERSPSKAAEVLASMSENNLSMLSMVANFMNQFAEQQPESPWLRIAQQAVQGIQEYTSQLMDMRSRQPQLAGQTRQVMQSPQAQPQTPDEWADAIVNEPNVPAEFKTPAWRELFRAMHDPNVDPQDVADDIGEHLDRLRDTGGPMPEMWRSFHSDETKPASAFLRPMLMSLPVARDLARVNAICAAFDHSYEKQADAAPAQQEHRAEVVG